MSTDTNSAPSNASASSDLTGKEIAGRFRILKKLGEGGMGAVYSGEQMSLKRRVAVKLLRPELGANQMILRRFNAEAEVVAKLDHPNTVKIYDFGQDTDGSLFIAMEYVDGRSLRTVLQLEAPLSPARALAIALQVAASLSDAHSHSIVHRDLKPDNVMLQDKAKQRDVVRVLDFGIAKLRDDNRQTHQAMTQAGDMLGTPQYMAPEQIKGESIDGRTDIYALGCMIYEMVTARLAFEAPTIMAMLSKHLMEEVIPPTQRRPDLALPPAIDQLVLSAMSKSPAMRPTTMEQFSDMISAVLASLPSDSNRSAGLPPPGVPPQQVTGGSSSVHAVGPAITPAAYSAFGPPSGPGPHAYPSHGPGPQGIPSFGGPPHGGFPSHAPMPPVGAGPGPEAYLPAHAGSNTFSGEPTKSRAPLFAILAVVLLAGAGVGVWALTRDDGKAGPSKEDPWGKVPSNTPAQPSEPPQDPPDPPDTDDDPPPAKDDPWGGNGASAAPIKDSGKAAPVAAKAPAKKKVLSAKAAPVNVSDAPIPTSAKLVAPAGFTKISETESAVVYFNASRNHVILMASLEAGIDDPQKIAQAWTAATGAQLLTTDTVSSGGAQRPALAFTHNVNGVPVAQAVVLYFGSTYRLGVLYQAPMEHFVDPAFQAEVDQFYSNNVKLP
jgi:serine/threonine protein kinase